MILSAKVKISVSNYKSKNKLATRLKIKGVELILYYDIPNLIPLLHID